MRRRKLFPAPPPTPKGMVWRTVDYRFGSETKLIPAKEAHQASKKIMAAFDAQPRFIRKQQWGQ